MMSSRVFPLANKQLFFEILLMKGTFFEIVEDGPHETSAYHVVMAYIPMDCIYIALYVHLNHSQLLSCVSGPLMHALCSAPASNTLNLPDAMLTSCRR